MAAVLTGTPVAVTWASGANPAGQSITIPSDATAVVMCAAFWASTEPSGLSSATLNGNAPSRNGQLETGQLASGAPATMYAIWDAPATGSRTLDPAWTVSPDEGPTCIVFFVKDCDVASNWGIQLDHDRIGNAVTVTLTTESGELCVAFDTREGTAPSNSSGWTSQQTHANNSYGSRLKSISASGSSQVVNSENEAFSGLIGFAIPAGAVGEDDPTITDVDTDEVVLDGQTSVAVTGTDMGADETERTFTLRQGSTSVPQTETGSGTDTAATLTIGIEQSGADIKFGSATLRVTRTDDDAYGEIAITVNPPTGQLYVDIGTPDSEADNRITAVDDIASGDQIQARGEGGGAVPAGLNLESDGTFWFADGETPTAFDVRVWDASDATWGAWATQSIASGGSIISETASAADSVSSTVAYSATIAESASAADSLAATLAAVAAVAETGTIADSINAALAATAAISETGDAQFAPTTGAAISAAIVETAAAADSVASVLAAVAALSESGAASDSVSAIASLVAALSESMTASDTVSWGGAVYSVDIAEAANATNTLTAAVSALAALAETGNATDTVSALASLQAALAEAGTALDTLTVTGVYGVSVSEAGDITFTVSVDSGILPGTPARSVTVRAANRTITVRAANRTVTVH